MIRWQRSITVSVLAKVGGREQFSPHLSHCIDDLAGFEDPFCDERLDQSFPLTCVIYGPRSSLRSVKAELSILDSLVCLAQVPMNFRFYARGHPAVLSTHTTTLELTKEAALSKNGNCIIAVGSSAGLRDLPQAMKNALSSETCRARLTLTLGDHRFSTEGHGTQGLTFSHPTDIVVRRSGFVSDRTLMVHANRAASDLPRSLVELLQDPSRKILVELTVET